MVGLGFRGLGGRCNWRYLVSTLYEMLHLCAILIVNGDLQGKAPGLRFRVLAGFSQGFIGFTLNPKTFRGLGLWG